MTDTTVRYVGYYSTRTNYPCLHVMSCLALPGTVPVGRTELQLPIRARDVDALPSIN
jgi:hypothetical protein